MGAPHPGCFLQEWQIKGLWLTRFVRMANAGLKAAVFSAICETPARAAGKGVREGQLRTGSSQLTAGQKEKDNAEALSAQRLRREDGDAGRDWKPMFTVYVTATLDNLSSYFLYSNDSNGVRVGRKLIRGMGIYGIWGAKMVFVSGRLSPVGSEVSEVKTRTLKSAGMRHPRVFSCVNVCPTRRRCVGSSRGARSPRP